MILITDINGRRHMLNRGAIARISEPGDSSAWHGVRAYVSLFDGTTIESRDSVVEIADQIEKGRDQ